MREPNIVNAALNRAAITISHTHYDRRALDVSDPLSLINSLIHLAHLTATSPRVRNLFTRDGGILRLVCITQTTRPTDTQSALLWITAYQVLANVIVKGTDRSRIKAVKLGVISVCVNVLSAFLKSWSTEVMRSKSIAVGQTPVNSGATTVSVTMQQVLDMGSVIQSPSVAERSLDNMRGLHVNNNNVTMHDRNDSSHIQLSNIHQEMEGPIDILDHSTTHDSNIATTNLPSLTTPFYLSRHQDLLLTLQVLVKLTDIPAIRLYLRNASCVKLGVTIATAVTHNVYAYLEPLTRVPQQHIRSLAITIMQNSTLPVPMPISSLDFAIDSFNSTSGITPVKFMHACANLRCQNTELGSAYSSQENNTPPSLLSQSCFARCSRCKRARYCGRECQVVSWSTHRYWCLVVGGDGAPKSPDLGGDTQTSNS